MQLEHERAMLFYSVNAYIYIYVYENELSLVISCDKSADAKHTNRLTIHIAADIYAHVHTQRNREIETEPKETTDTEAFVILLRNAVALWLLCVSLIFSSSLSVSLSV